MYEGCLLCPLYPLLVKHNNELVDRAAFIDSVGILSADLKDKAFEKLCDSLV